MSRTKKTRTVCSCLLCEGAGHGILNSDGVLLSVDELESLRLADLEGLEQSVCSERMGVSRGTFQRVLYEARKKVAYGLVSGVGVRLEAGGHDDVALAGECSSEEYCRYCGRRLNVVKCPSKGRLVLGIGSEGNHVATRLEESSDLHFYEVCDGRVVRSWREPVTSHACEFIVSCLSGHHVDVLFCGGIAGELRMALAGHGIGVATGVSGASDAVVSGYVAGTLRWGHGESCHCHGGSSHGCLSS